MTASWISLYPYWYINERKLLSHHYPDFRPDERLLKKGSLVVYGNIQVHPPGGSQNHAVMVIYPEGTPFEHPVVLPIEDLPFFNDKGSAIIEPKIKWYDHRHQMPAGNLCLFQRETRTSSGGDILDITQILTRAEEWFMGVHTGRWPPDTDHSELEYHFSRVSNILIAETFYESDLHGYGRLFFALDYQRTRNSSDPTHVPRILTALTKEDGIIQSIDARDELSRLYPWIDDNAWNADKLIAIDDLANAEVYTPLSHGYWWSLPSEPQPFRDGRGFLNALSQIENSPDPWKMIEKQLGSDLTLSPAHFLGLRYPAREGGFEWLILLMPTTNVKKSGGVALKSDSEKKKEFEASHISALASHRVNPSVIKLRNTGVIDNQIQRKTVGFIGLGALGSKVAELLAQAGVGSFQLCDSDCLETGNVARHIGGISDFGLPKTLVVMKRLLEINPYLDFGKIHSKSASSSLRELEQFIMTVDLVICTTADESVESIINQLSVLKRKPVLYGRSIKNGSMGRVFLVKTSQDACKACLGEYLSAGRRGEETPEDWIDITEDEESIILHECGRPVIASSAIDLSFTSSLIARVALDYLEGKELDGNHWVWSLNPAPDIDERLARKMGVFAGEIPPFRNCPTCQEPDVTELIMTDEVKNKIVSLTEESPNVETGGVLIGYIDKEDRAISIRATEPGPKAERSATFFRRDVEYIQSELDKAAEELGDSGMYIGEWHSHLVADPQPSATDVGSLFGISKAPNCLTRCPVMVIAGLDNKTKTVVNLRSWVFPVGGRIYSIKHQTIRKDEIDK